MKKLLLNFRMRPCREPSHASVTYTNAIAFGTVPDTASVFTTKNKLFKQEQYLNEVKCFYTDLINRMIDGDKDKLQVFDKNGLYLATKKIGKNEEIRILKGGLSGIVRQYSFATVEDFYTAFYASKDAFYRYQKECTKWQETYGKKDTPKEESFEERLQKYRQEVERQYSERTYRNKDKGAR